MEEHRLIFKFDGLRAELGRLDGSDAEHSAAGIRRLLSLLAHAYSTGRVPANAHSHTNHYAVERATSKDGSFEDPWVVSFYLPLAAMMVGTYAIRALDAFGPYALECIRACLDDRLPYVPYEERMEPVLSRQDRGNAPVFDVEENRLNEQRRLKRAGTIALFDAARPVGRSANSLRIISEHGDSVMVQSAEQVCLAQLRRSYLQSEIASYMEGIRQGSKHRIPVSAKRVTG